MCTDCPLCHCQKERSEISIAKIEMDTRSDLSPPLPPFTPSFLPSHPAPGPADVTVPFSLLLPSPLLSSRVKHHYIITQGWIIVMVVCEAGKRLGD